MILRFFEWLQRKKQLFVLKKNPHISLGNIKLGINNHFLISEKIKKIKIGNSVSLRNYVHILVGKEASLEIGNNVFMNNFCSINCLHSISIGENTLFGENVKIYDHNHSYSTSPEIKISHSDFTSAPINIGKNCWLGSNVTVLKGVSIGNNCIIGAGCTIFKNVPDNTRLVNRQDLIIKPHLLC